ncbi:MAG: ATP-dependent helicase HrpB [Campylobacterales bacterium]
MKLPSALSALPVYGVLPQITQALSTHNRLILEAPPGAGKSTAVPLALLDEPWRSGLIVMLQPRRLAARTVAARMADLLGEHLGDRVGYQVKNDRVAGPDTRILVVTEGILTRMLQADPALEKVSLIIFDEFHERNLHGDLALTLSLQSQQLLREDLKILVMSATLEGGLLQTLLQNPPHIRAEGRSFPVQTCYLDAKTPQPDIRALPECAAQSVKTALQTHGGNLLVFLPGAGEIRRTQALLSGLDASIILAPLFGDLSKAAQEAAILPPPPGKRKVVLATNIAETSLTIEGVSVVIDGGFERALSFHYASGMDRLETARIAQASAVQRAGRAGRLEPGTCYRLWHETTALAARRAPEIATADLSGLMLELARWGAWDTAALDWPTPPPEVAVQAAKTLLSNLEAVDEKGRITPHGEAVLALGAHPRLGHMMIKARELGEGVLGALIAGLLTEKDPFREAAFGADLEPRASALFGRWRSRDETPALTAAREFLKRLGGGEKAPDFSLTGALLALAYPDRIAKARGGGDGRYLLSGGKGAWLDKNDGLSGQPFLVAANLDGNAQEAKIRLAAVLDEAAIARFFAPQSRFEVRWNPQAGRIEAKEERVLGALVLSSRDVAPPKEKLPDLWLALIRKEGFGFLPLEESAVCFLQRIRFLARHNAQELTLPDFCETALLETLETWLLPHLAGISTRRDLENLNWTQIFEGFFEWNDRQQIDALAPAKLTVASGSKVTIDYADPDAPVLAVRIQELFGTRDHPTVLRGRHPLTVHLLSPAQRPIQITRDLPGFWAGSYKEVKKELFARYPKHYWPDNPAEAQATTRTKKFM